MNVTLVKSNNFIRFTNTNARSATFPMKLSASGVEPTFSQGKATYLTIGLLRQLNISTNIKVILKWNVCT
ncbi:hypothetical protein PFNF54_03922 [Plasmodium falciparum NF54]|uniref:Uncharacterized protein n=1 Tax=Plasmodium falciparum (isolate NF54) TaxID=5843 RepID=W7JQY8_PLAFO|nr:hypothetical protein PFNF54_03922 [Plasmodium falciparum NF54]